MNDTLRKIKNFILPEIKEVKIVHRNIREDIAEADINKELAKDRGFSRGELAVKNAELKRITHELKKLKGKEKVEEEDASQQEFKELVRQNTSLSKKLYVGNFAIGKLYKPLKEGNKKTLKDKVKVLSYDHQTFFGFLHELLMLKSGRIAVVVKDKKGNTKPVIVGSTISDIFTNYQSLTTELSLGILTINVSSTGDHHIDPFAEEVPRTIITATGRVTRSDYDTERAMNLIDELTAEKLEMAERIRRYESALHEQSIKIKTQNQANKLLSESTEDSKSIMIAAINASNEKGKVFHELQQQAHMNDFAKGIEEQRNEKLEEVRTEVMKKLGDKLGASNKEEAEEDIKSLINWVFNKWGQPQQEAFEEMNKKFQEQNKELEMLKTRKA